jgi:nucleotide-binding universal stress UspA family protein
MIPEIKKILYATDLSENARFAFGYAVSLANRYDARIVVLHVNEDISPQMNAQVADLLGAEKWQELQLKRKKEVVELLVRKIEAFCAETAAADQSCPFTVTEIKVRNGHPVEEIIAESIASDYDVIVMGTHGHGILAGAMMGSTAMRVVRRSHVPVMVIRLPKTA